MECISGQVAVKASGDGGKVVILHGIRGTSVPNVTALVGHSGTLASRIWSAHGITVISRRQKEKGVALVAKTVKVALKMSTTC